MTFYRYHIFLFLTQIVHKLDNHIDSTILSYGGEGMERMQIKSNFRQS